MQEDFLEEEVSHKFSGKIIFLSLGIILFLVALGIAIYFIFFEINEKTYYFDLSGGEKEYSLEAVSGFYLVDREKEFFFQLENLSNDSFFLKGNNTFEIKKGIEMKIDIEEDGFYDAEFFYFEGTLRIKSINESVCGECQYLKEGKCLDYVCCKDEDCDDGKINTVDSCLGSFTRNANCSNELIVCGECQYLKEGKCLDYVCCKDEDCDDGSVETLDRCIGQGTLNAECKNNFIEPECEIDNDCLDEDPCTIDTCEGIPAVCVREEITLCGEEDGCCPKGCSYVDDVNCNLPLGFGTPFEFIEVETAVSNNPHAIVLFQNFYYDPEDNSNHGMYFARGELDPTGTFSNIGIAPEKELLLVTVLVVGDYLEEQIITATFDGEEKKIYLPEENPALLLGEQYYVAEDGSTFYLLYGGTGNFVPPDEAFVLGNLARSAV